MTAPVVVPGTVRLSSVPPVGLHEGQALWVVASPDGLFPALSYEDACTLAAAMTKTNAKAWMRTVGSRLARAEVTLSPYHAAEHYRLCALRLQAQLMAAQDLLNRTPNQADYAA